MHGYHDVNHQFPSEGGYTGTGQTATSFYVGILPQIEQGNQNPASPLPIAMFLCPTRRGTMPVPRWITAAATTAALFPLPVSARAT